MKIRKAIIPVAGLGTRMLPATKAIPKEMLPIVDKPLIQYVVNEAVSAGIKNIILVTHSSKNAIENHFDKSFELEATLEKRVKRQLLQEIQSIIPADVTIMHVRQGEARGLADAILCARDLVDDGPFAILLPDVLIDEFTSNPGRDNLAEMVKNFESTGISQIMVEKVPHEQTGSYGIVASNQNLDNATPGSTFDITDMVEKPRPEQSPSNMAVVGRYVLSGNIWPLFRETPLGAGGELQLTDTLRLLLRQEKIAGYCLCGKSWDCGNKLGYMEANIEYASRHPKIGAEFRKFLETVIREHNPSSAVRTNQNSKNNNCSGSDTEN
ncbi:UTP--glucose-1-phosphate uridylyltransferase GalU [Succinimonas amylolytica]|uniref:UTP--glucose-1-phosphate uridylyltransferase GalU n=1 Tax=Succinimonas amylolytica TaxID=83769 RepID=UPI0003692B3B|nr:UTP--glucose-1-phosphate uridylyltransferase GalU [Succinimonas amylolytica]